MKIAKNLFWLCLIVILSVSALGCSKSSYTREANPTPENEPQFITQKKIGYIKPIEVSIFNEGTHVLLNDLENEELLMLLESNTLRLNDFIAEEVEVTGQVRSTIEGNIKIMDVTDILSISQAKKELAIQAARELAPLFDPPFILAEEDIVKVASLNAAAGTAVLQVTKVDEAQFVIKMVQKPEPLTGNWEIYAIMDAATYVPEDEEAATDEIEDDSEADDETTTEDQPTEEAAITIEPINVSSAVPQEFADLIAYFNANLNSVLPEDAPARTAATLKNVSFTNDNYAYLEYAGDSGKGMVLLSYSPSGDKYQVTVQAAFQEGTGTDWERVSGTNSKVNAALEVFAKQGSNWEKVVSLQESFAWLENVYGKYAIQYPKHWYYWHMGGGSGILNSVSFSNQPVEENNILVKITILSLDYVSSTNAEAEAISFGEITVGEVQGKKFQSATGRTKIYLPQTANTTYLFEAESGQEQALLKMIQTLNTKQ